MSKTKLVITKKDSTLITLNEADITGKIGGKILSIPKRSVPGSNGLQWWIGYMPAGLREANVLLFLWVNKPVKAKCTFAIDDSSISNTVIHEFTDSPDNRELPEVASHEQIRPLFRDGKLTITCSVEFEILLPVAVSNCQLFRHVPTDIDLVIGSKRVPAHKYFLFLISPVFQAMFTHDTVESKSSEVEITEFDYDTVKTAINICYGQEFITLSVETVVGILRFCDKYFITPVINELEKLSLLTPSVDTFCDIVHYAYDCNKDALLHECYAFFKEHQDEIKATEKFAELPPALVVDTLKAASYTVK